MKGIIDPKRDWITPWQDIAGLKCRRCGGFASHFDGSGDPVCCKCHGGNYFKPEDVEFAHKMVLKERRMTTSQLRDF